MRAAPPVDPPADVAPDEQSERATDNESMDAPSANGYRRPRLGTVARLAVAIIALGLLAVSVAFVIAKKPSVATRPRPPVASPPAPRTPPFAFTEAHLHTLPSRNGVPTTAATSVLDSARTSLTSFYSLTLTTPSTWSRGVPNQAWDGFAPDAGDRARSDAASLALGNQLPDLEAVRVASATLDVSVLVDATGHAQAATAAVSIHANGVLRGGQPVVIGIDASFVLRRLDRQWLITGWPSAHLTTGPAPTPTPSPTPAAGPSASPGASVATPTPGTSP